LGHPFDFYGKIFLKGEGGTLMLKKEIIDHIGLITIARPWEQNRVNGYMAREMIKILLNWQEDPQVKMVMLTGEGDIFCCGVDWGDRIRITDEEIAYHIQELEELLKVLYNFPKLTAALINGKTEDIGCELAAVCDFRLAHPGVKICFDHMSYRLTPDLVGAQYLFRCLPRMKALELLSSGRKISSSEAYKIGFIDKILPETKFYSEALNWSRPFTHNKLDLLLKYKQLAIKSERSS
jgi:enoyl-CoA hydratase/carnithine racemase